MLLVVFVALGAHVAGQVVDRERHDGGVVIPAQRADHLLDVFAVVLVGDPALRVAQRMGRYGQLLPRGARIGRVDIELEIRHDEEVVPQLVGEVGRVPQQRKQVAHHGDYGPRLAVALAPVPDGKQGVDHLVDMAAVFGQE